MIRLRSDSTQHQLGKLLEQERLVTKDQFRALIRRAKDENRALTDVLYEDQAASADQVLAVVGQHYELPTVRLRDKVITPYVLGLLPKEVAEQHEVIVFKKIQNVIQVATTHPEDAQTIDFIRRHTSLEPEVFLTTPEDIRHALRMYRTNLSEEFQKIIDEGLKETQRAGQTNETLAQNLPIITMVNSVIEKAIHQGASDIHLEPTLESVGIRFRVDGILQKVVELPRALLAPIVTRIKLIAALKIDEHRLPQDGRFTYELHDRSIAIRTSVVPTLHGPKVVMRLLDEKQQRYNLRSLGLNQRDFAILKREIVKPNGMMLVTGPTGSGKTTTLYTMLSMLNSEEVNICTIEDPIEYGLEGINQTQVNPTAGLTFANGLRSLLRQDPNVIMVGEIRDEETADIAVNAAMTGHLVLSTLHTNSAPQSIQRMIEMGIQPYLAASTINVIIAQRLVRKICRHCQTYTKLNERMRTTQAKYFDLEATLKKLIAADLLPGDATLDTLQVAVGKGCVKCQDTGYSGRVGIYEVIPVDEAIHTQILADATPHAIREAADHLGMLRMVDDGLLKVFSGLTTFEEVLRVTK